MDRILIGIIGIPLGFVIVYYKRKLYEIIGPVGWFEKYAGPGSSDTFYFLIGFLCFILSLMYATGTLQSFFYSTFGRFFGAK
jgi:hypothetical protein